MGPIFVVTFLNPIFDNYGEQFTSFPLKSEPTEYKFHYGVAAIGGNVTFKIIDSTLFETVFEKTIRFAPGPPVLTVGSGATNKEVKIQLAPFNHSDLSLVDEFQFWYHGALDETVIRENETLSSDNPTTFTVVKPGDLNYYYAYAVKNGLRSTLAKRAYRTSPNVVKNLVVHTVTNSSFVLNWTLPDDSTTTFHFVEIYDGGEKLVTLGKNFTSYSVTDYPPSALATLQGGLGHNSMNILLSCAQ